MADGGLRQSLREYRAELEEKAIQLGVQTTRLSSRSAEECGYRTEGSRMMALTARTAELQVVRDAIERLTQILRYG